MRPPALHRSSAFSAGGAALPAQNRTVRYQNRTPPDPPPRIISLIISILILWHSAGICPHAGGLFRHKNKKLIIMNRNNTHPAFFTAHTGIMPLTVLYIA